LSSTVVRLTGKPNFLKILDSEPINFMPSVRVSYF
jgi:hypothetical protein